MNLYASTFCGWLNSLPPYRALMVMMEQCGSGGFCGGFARAVLVSAVKQGNLNLNTSREGIIAEVPIALKPWVVQRVVGMAGADAAVVGIET